MLRSLRRHLALLNAAISGAILLAMALLALSVSDSALERQYERELDNTSSGLYSAMSQPLDSVKIAYATSDNVLVYFDSGGRSIVAGKAATSDQTAVSEAVQVARAQVEAVKGNYTITTFESAARVAIDDAEPKDTIYLRVFQAPDDATLHANNIADAVSANGEITVSQSASSTGMTFPGDGAKVKIARAGNILATDDMDADAHIWSDVTAIDTINQAQSTSGNVAMIYSLPYQIVESGDRSYRVAATVSSGDAHSLLMLMQDRTEEIAARAQLRLIYFGCAMGGLLLVGAASMFLSRRATAPVETSLKQQRAFVAAASHELRTPVASLRANAEVLRDAELGQFEPFLESIEQESGRLAHLVADLIDLARADAGELQFRDEQVDAADVCEKTVTAMKPLAVRRGIELIGELSPASFRGDSDRLRQALVALLDNALRYVPYGGHVLVRCGRERGYIFVSVIDDGPGIPDEHKRRVFDRFYRVDAARTPNDGSGLGLSVARQLVERMKGAIEISDSEAATGCAFTMRWKVPRGI